MLNFKTELKSIVEEVMKDYEQQPFVEINYPKAIDLATWEFHIDSVNIPKQSGQLYFIFDGSKKLLYIGKTKEITLALRNHLIKHTSISSKSILEEIKGIVSKSDDKKIYLKTIELKPIELASYLKPCLIEEYDPLFCQRLS